VSLPRAVLDSNIIYSRTLHELMGRVATDIRLFDLIWSDQLIDEAKRVLVENKGLSPQAAEFWVGHMTREFPAGRVEISGNAGLDLSKLTKDPDDEHVCELAVVGRADLLFTDDKGFRKRALRKQGVELAKPGRYLNRALKEQPDAFRELLARQAASWGGGKPVDELLDALTRAGVGRFAARARDLFGPAADLN
jgi:predicted nucleic acid-binding protein